MSPPGFGIPKIFKDDYYLLIMATEMVQVPKEEYDRLKEMSQIDWELVEKIKNSLEDVKHGRITEVKPR